MNNNLSISSVGEPSVLLADDIWCLLRALDTDANNEAKDEQTQSGSNVYPIKHRQGGRGERGTPRQSKHENCK